ncbi:MAG: hypothetical protein K9M98_15360 [Cephaloticoccus sp.]|nr:hypothetical protein [Cephaloticoccus sp.]MCF7761878.1 hypothetical protein [Cephaloticoccus sp.]
MSNPESIRSKSPSLMDYVVRYDLASMLEEARQDYTRSSSGGPRHLDQKDIAARFRSKKGKSPQRNDPKV